MYYMCKCALYIEEANFFDLFQKIIVINPHSFTYELWKSTEITFMFKLL